MESPGAGHVHGSQPFSSNTALPTSYIPVEMTDLDTSKKTAAGEAAAAESRAGGAGSGSQGLLNHVSIPSTSPIETSFSSTYATATAPNENTKPASSSTAPTNPIATTARPGTTTSAKASESNSSAAPEPVAQPVEAAPSPTTAEASSVLLIQLLPQVTAKQVPFNIDERFLTKRGVDVPSKTDAGKADPYSISAYTLKELILRSWKEEWGARPTNPTNIRLIFYGRMLDDKSTLTDCRFVAGQPNILHMSVRPQDIVDEEDAGKNKQSGRERDGEEETAGCRCVIQ